MEIKVEVSYVNGCFYMSYNPKTRVMKWWKGKLDDFDITSLCLPYIPKRKLKKTLVCSQLGKDAGEEIIVACE